MNNKPSADEEPKRTIAKNVMANKRQYFFPQTGKSIEASDIDEAIDTHASEQSNDHEHGKDGDV